MTRIAIPTENNQVAGHFGHCPQFTMVDIEGNEIKKQEIILNPGHKPGFIPRFIHEEGADVVLACAMGQRAKNLFEGLNIEVMTGIKGSIEDVLSSYLAGSLESSGETCNHDHYQHHHHNH